MKSKKALLAALALSTALVAGTTVPALAAEGTDAKVDPDSGSSTTVKIATMGTSDQVSVTVPLSMTVVANVGGGDLITPTGYKISNSASCDVEVKGAYSLENAGFNVKLTTDDGLVGAGKAAPGGDLWAGYLKMTLTPAATADGTSWAISDEAPVWKIANGDELPITVAGATSQLTQQQTNASNAPAILKFTYTVSKASSSDASSQPDGE